VREIEKALSAARPVSARAFRRNARCVCFPLSALAADFEAAGEDVPPENIVTFHNVFGYLARDVGLTVVGEIETAPDRSRPRESSGTCRATIREWKVPAVFSEPQYPRSWPRRWRERRGSP